MSKKKDSAGTIYQCKRGYQGDFRNYLLGEIVEVVEIHAKVYEPSTILFKGRTGFVDQLEAKHFNARFIQDQKVTTEKDQARMSLNKHRNRT